MNFHGSTCNFATKVNTNSQIVVLNFWNTFQIRKRSEAIRSYMTEPLSHFDVKQFGKKIYHYQVSFIPKTSGRHVQLEKALFYKW